MGVVDKLSPLADFKVLRGKQRKRGKRKGEWLLPHVRVELYTDGTVRFVKVYAKTRAYRKRRYEPVKVTPEEFQEALSWLHYHHFFDFVLTTEKRVDVSQHRGEKK